MMLDLILKNRSYRRFDESFIIDQQVLRDLVNFGRLSASGRNAQPLKYLLSFTREKNEKVFPTLAWAGYLKDWNGPKIGERPSAYILMLNDTSVAENYFCDHGIAAQSILLGATELGLGGCIIMNIKKDELRQSLLIPAKFEILQVLALGKPVEQVVLEVVKPNGDIKYWRDEHLVHHVPKRSLDDIILSI